MVGLAQNHAARSPQPGHLGAVRRRRGVVARVHGALRRVKPGRVDEVFHADGDAGQRPGIVARIEACVDRGGREPGRVAVHCHESVEDGIEGLDALQRVLGDRGSREGAIAYHGHEGLHGDSSEVGYVHRGTFRRGTAFCRKSPTPRHRINQSLPRSTRRSTSRSSPATRDPFTSAASSGPRPPISASAAAAPSMLLACTTRVPPDA